MSNSFYKPVVGAALVAAGDNLILQNQNINSNLALGAAAGVAFYLSPNIAKMLPSQSSANNSMYDMKTLETRLAEIALAAGGGFAINNFVLRNPSFRRDDYIQKIGLIVAADFVAEYVDDYMNNRALAFLK